MDIYDAHLITFSPTHTSKQVGEAIVRGIGCSRVTITDLTLHTAEKFEIPQKTLVVITVPVYRGHVSSLALERMKNIRANGSPAVVVVVYGNRAYEKALTDLDVFVSELGFKVVAGGTFIGEHSYSNESNPIAVGRPDARDLKFAEFFGEKIYAKILAAIDMEKVYGVDVTRIQRPHQPLLPLLRFLRRLVKLKKNGVSLPYVPEVDAEHCTHCGYCASHCPAEAILKGNECDTIVEKCIKCCACVKGCPQKARSYNTPFAALLADCFQKQKENRIII